MQLDDYQREAMRFLNNDLPESTKLIHGPLGMANEAGEVLGLYKKHLIYGKPLVLEDLCKEVGDVLWYAARTAEAYKIKISDHMHVRIREGVNGGRGLYYPCMLSARTANVLVSAEEYWPGPMDRAATGADLAVIVKLCGSVLLPHAIPLSDAMEVNIDKLSRRFPSGKFSAADAIAKADEK